MQIKLYLFTTCNWFKFNDNYRLKPFTLKYLISTAIKLSKQQHSCIETTIIW